MPSQIAQLGLQTAGNIIGTGMGLLMEGHNDRRQLEQQQKLQDQQIAGNKEMVDYNMAKQLKMWKDTNYKAQMDEVIRAGLNPNAIFGHGGGGGITGQATGGVNGGQAPSGGGEILAQQGMMLQRGMMQAQIENLKADTEKKKAEATKTSGIDTQTGQQNLQQGAEKFKEELAILKNQALASIDELINTQTNRWINQQTKDAQVEKIKEEAIGEQLMNGIKRAQEKNIKADTGLKGAQAANTRGKTAQQVWETNVMRQEIRKMASEIYKNYRTTGINESQLALDIQDAIGTDDPDIVIPIIGSVKELLGKKGTTVPVRGFHNR